MLGSYLVYIPASNRGASSSRNTLVKKCYHYQRSTRNLFLLCSCYVRPMLWMFAADEGLRLIRDMLVTSMYAKLVFWNPLEYRWSIIAGTHQLPESASCCTWCKRLSVVKYSVHACVIVITITHCACCVYGLPNRGAAGVERVSSDLQTVGVRCPQALPAHHYIIRNLEN